MEEEKLEIMKEMIDDGRQPTSTSVTPSSTRPSSPVDGEPSTNETDGIIRDSPSEHLCHLTSSTLMLQLVVKVNGVSLMCTIPM